MLKVIHRLATGITRGSNSILLKQYVSLVSAPLHFHHQLGKVYAYPAYSWFYENTTIFTRPTTTFVTSHNHVLCSGSESNSNRLYFHHKQHDSALSGFKYRMMETVVENDQDFGEKVTEGQVTAYLPKNVFYNPVQEFNRDLTINVISEYGKLIREEQQLKKSKKAPSSGGATETADNTGFEEDKILIKVNYDPDDRVAGQVYDDGLTILEGLAASGLRSVRFCKEIPGVKSVVANDFSRDAVRCMEENIKLNDVGNIMKTSCEDAALLMYKASREKDGGYDVIDLDPYGGPTKFLDGAVQAVNDGGLLCVTCTDMAVLCGNASEKCFAAYGAMSLKSSCCHEIALRIILRTVDSYANRYGKYIVPLLSVSVDFYSRVFVRVFNSPKKAKESASKSAMVYECTGCSAYTLQPLARIEEFTTAKGQKNKKFTFSTGPVLDKLCEHCQHTHHIGGPLWSAPLHDFTFLERLVKRVQRDSGKFGTSKRLIGMMTIVSEELPDVPLYYVPDQLCGVVHITSPSFKILRSAILNAGYRVSLSHAHLNSIKTDAPMEVLWDILRCWNKRHTVKESRLIPGTPCAAILSKEPQLEANFEIHEQAEPASRKQGLLRYQTGMKDWGPKARASNKIETTQNEKRKQNQNKRALKKMKRDGEEDYYKQFPCTRFDKEGSCDYGKDCKYSHSTADVKLNSEDSVSTDMMDTGGSTK